MTMACVRRSEVSSRIGCRTTARTSRSFRGEIRVAPCRSNSQESRRAEPPSESSNSPAECVARVKVFRGLDVIAAEYKATDQVPAKARTFTGWDQFTLWFAAASLPAAWLYGGYMTGAYGLPGAFALIFLVSTLTFIPWALIGYIAADKGASSVSLLRPAFGLRGSKLPSVFYLFFGYGWAAVNVFIAAISMSFVFNLTLGWPDAFHTPAGSPINYYLVPSILLICLLQGFFATAGHRAIRYLNWASTIALVVLGAYASYIVLKDFDFGQLWAWRPAQPLSFTFTAGALGTGFTYTLTFPLLLDLLIAYNWTWEFIGDFSRFARSKKAGTWGPFAGASLAQYWFFSDFLGSIVVPLSTLTLVDYFLVKARRYHDDLFAQEGGHYWYRGGWNWPAVVTLLSGTALYWMIAFGFPAVRETISAALPTIIFVVFVYYFWGRSAWERQLRAVREGRLVASSSGEEQQA